MLGGGTYNLATPGLMNACVTGCNKFVWSWCVSATLLITFSINLVSFMTAQSRYRLDHEKRDLTVIIPVENHEPEDGVNCPRA